MPVTLVWFRQDLRLADHPALHAAVTRGAVIPVYVEGFDEEGAWAPGAASRWWLHHSLQALDASLRALGSRLIVCRGPALAVLAALCGECGADAVYWSRRYEPAAIERDRRVKETLHALGIDARSFNAALLVEPWETRNRAGQPFLVFGPFARSVRANCVPAAPLPAPSSVAPPERWPASVPLDALRLLPRIRWDSVLATSWRPGEAGAHARLDAFLAGALDGYADGRDRPDRAGTSRLSPHLHFGEISPRHVWHALARRHPGEAGDAGKFRDELLWREFAHHLLYHFPRTAEEPLREEFARFPWRTDPAQLEAWRRGRTGIPLVDAGMRELWATGWMHNRVRMVVASFLVKNLRMHWLEGARWFHDTLVDADLANNTLGWQWTAGCGADAAPYFRVFNPLAQAQKFDPDGAYVRRWVPECGTPGQPSPIVDLAASRAAALQAWQQMRGA